MSYKARDFLLELDQPPEPIALPELDTIEETKSLQVFKPLERQVIELALDALSPDTIALRTALPVSVVRAILARKDVKEHLEFLSTELNAAEVIRLKSLYGKVLDARIEEADGDLSKLSKRDTLDIMKAYQELLVAERKAQKPEQEQNVFINILNQVMGD
jgi:hypothetical protein